MAELEDVVEELYGLRPDEFVPARDDAVAQARTDGDKDLAKAIARLRRPTKAAWLANLLARNRGEQLDGLLSLGGDLADAQRTLDGATLRALSSQRNRLVAAMAREAGRLAYEAGDSAAESVLSDLRGILEAALADPEVAAEVRSGRMSRTVAYSGFGPPSEPGAVPMPRRVTPPAALAPPAPAPDPDVQERERRARERAERERALAEAEAEEAAALARQQADEDAKDDAESAHTAAREHVADLVRELEAAREAERTAGSAARTAAATAKESARITGAASTRTARARAHLEELGT